MGQYILEACVDSVESALAAANGGATRLELCSGLIIGGVTADPSLFQEIRKNSSIPIHALIRPRFGDFCYTDYEYEVIKRSVKMYGDMGAEGVVIGILKPDGTLNIEQMKGLIEEARGLSVTLHRAFDLCADPYEAMEQAIALGFRTILTSGQKSSGKDGLGLLKALVEKSRGRIDIQIGAGVGPENIKELFEVTHAPAYHMSGKIVLDSRMQYRKEGVNMGLPSISEYDIWRTDEEKIKETREKLDQMAMREAHL